MKKLRALKSNLNESKVLVKKRKHKDFIEYVDDFIEEADKVSITSKIPNKKSKSSVEKDSLFDEDDAEIRRLENLLGIGSGKSKIKSAARLNREYEVYEGISGDVGDFLMELEETIHNIEFKKSDKKVAEKRMREDIGNAISHVDLCNDDRAVNLVNDDINAMAENYSEDKVTNEKAVEAKVIPAQDIYGRLLDQGSTVSIPKFVPPAKRQLGLAITAISESELSLKRELNGLINRLSDQTRNSIFTSVLNLFNSNSINVMNQLLCENMKSMLATGSMAAKNIVPNYSALISALHIVFGAEVSGNILETLISTINSRLSKSEQTYLDNKISDNVQNAMAILTYLYNFRIFHSSLLIEILKKLIEGGVIDLDDFSVGLIQLIIENCGSQLRSDDPGSLLEIFTTLLSTRTDMQKSGKFRLLLDTIDDIKSNISKRQKVDILDNIKSLKKWLGEIKFKQNASNMNTRGSSNKVVCLQVSYSDLINADSRGRWWKAGASWKGRITEIKDQSVSQESSNVPIRTNSENEKFETLAQKLHMNTELKKSIFIIIMSCRDSFDCFEELIKLNLKGKQDRDVIFVILECCAHEKVYNPFYAEILSALCNQSRQLKITLQYFYWDILKNSFDITLKSQKRRCENLARLLVDIVAQFHLSLAVFKIIDLSEIEDGIKLFLQIFFTCLFESKVGIDSYQSIFERVATSPDFSVTRDNILLFLKIHFRFSAESASSSQPTDSAKERKQIAIKILKSMKVLDYTTKKDHS